MQLSNKLYYALLQLNVGCLALFNSFAVSELGWISMAFVGRANWNAVDVEELPHRGL